MRVVIQRVLKASVSINNEIYSQINEGLLVFVGIEDEDSSEDVQWLSSKIVNLRIFDDEHGVMNKGVMDFNYQLLVVSQFTLHASTKKGNRPSYINASKPDIAIPLYENFVQQLSKATGTKVETGVFGADMKIELINNGPVTIIIDTKNKE